MDRMKSLLESYYGISEKKRSEGGEDLDRSELDVGEYVGDKLRNAGLKELLKADDSLVQEVRTLDADMQLLVYDNYSKFISATDTIRSMKDNVERIEGEIQVLASKMDKIGTVANSMNERMGPKRSKIEKLVGLQNLIRKLNFLFELPVRLNECLALDAPSQAVSYYKRAVPILEKHSEVTSFASIARESHEIMRNLAQSLRSKLRTSTLSLDKYTETMTLYIDLQQDGDRQESETLDRASLSREYLDWCDTYFNNKIASVVAHQEAISLEEFVETLCSSVLEPLAVVCTRYVKLFLMRREISSTDGEDAEGSENSEADEQDEDNEEKGQAMRNALSEFAKPLLNSFLHTIRSRLTAQDVSFTQMEDEEENMEDTDEGSGKVRRRAVSTGQYRPLLSALNVLFRRLNGFEIDGFVRRGYLADRATEIAEHAVRKQVVSAFDILREKVSAKLSTCFAECEMSEQQDHHTLEDQDDDTEAKNTTNPSPKERATALMIGVEGDVAETMVDLDSLLRESSDILSEMSAIFDNLIKFQLRFWILWLANAMECFCDPYHPYRKPAEGTEPISIQQPNSERAKILVTVPVKVTVPPSFVLCLACLTEELRLFIRKSPYPIAGTPDLMNEVDYTKESLLICLVELSAWSICDKIRPELEEPTSVSLQQTEPPTQVRPFAVAIVDMVKALMSLVAASKGQENVLTRQQNSNMSAASSPGARASATRYARKPSSLHAGGNVHLDIERMFSQKVNLVENVEFMPESVALAVLKIVLKSIIEYTTRATFSTCGFQQLEVDTFFLRSIFPVLIEDTTLLYSMLTQILAVARERTEHPVPLQQDTIDQLCRNARESRSN